MSKETRSVTYKDAGVDIDAKARAILGFRDRAAATLGSGAGPIGHFGGTYRIPAGPDRILVASADGVGTKLRLAFVLGGQAHWSVGRDIVNHCVNDILALGAEPLFFLDYFGTSKLDIGTVTAVVDGISHACLASGMALLGGETAEMPDMYGDGEYDLAGFIVGTVAPDRVIDGLAIVPGDVVIGLPSTGLHTNGYSLARKLLGLNGETDHDRGVLDSDLPGSAETIGTALLAGHRLYLLDVQPLIDAGVINGMAHITGGGLIDNLPRTLPGRCVARLDRSAWDVPAIFQHLVALGNIDTREQHRVFNMGIGFVLVIGASDVDAVLESLPDARVIGEIVARTSDAEASVQGVGEDLAAG